MQQPKQPFSARLQLLARLTVNTGTTPPTSQLDWLSSTTAMKIKQAFSLANKMARIIWGPAGQRRHLSNSGRGGVG